MIATSTKLNKSKFAPLFGDYWDKIEPGFEKGILDEVMAHIKKRAALGHEIAPASHNLFRCFRETPLSKLRVVIVGFCPYHTKRDGKIVADGLCLSNSLNDHYSCAISPSLDQFYRGLENELNDGLNLDYVQNYDLSYLAKQGVLLYNAALTTEIGLAGAHQELWKPFSRYLMEHIVDPAGVPVVYLGTKAADIAVSIENGFFLDHPASSSYQGVSWTTGGAFTQINEMLKEPIEWMEQLPF